ncbi:MAG: histone deacetylase, partial [Candidatus Neomarinimicrobiota bacterium]
MNSLRLYWSPAFSEHEVGPGHPESPARIKAVRSRLEAKGLWDQCTPEEARAATREELLPVHPAGYLQRVEQAARGRPGPFDSPDTVISPGSWPAALKVAGAGFQAVNAVLEGNVNAAFILGRPPGHHALPERAMGFCFLANAALAAEHARHRHGLERIAIIDWDVHHGNGTQEIFYNNENVYYISMHEWPLFPGTGAADEKGSGRGQGFTLNFPL